MRLSVSDPFRHRRGSLWHASGMPARELAERMGHSKASMSLDVYTHVMPPDEVAPERIEAALQAPRRTAPAIN